MTTKILALRDYQREAIDALYKEWEDTRVLADVLPTASGKTVIFAHLVKEYLESCVGKKALILVHTDELVQQAHEKIEGNFPSLSVGIIKAEQNDVDADAIVASVATLRNKARLNQLENVGLIIVDECHHALANSYQVILDHYPEAKVVGFTATFARGDKQSLASIFKVAYVKDIIWMIKHGYLLDVKGKHIQVDDLDLSKVHTRGGDFRDEELAEALEVSMAPEIVAKAYKEHASDRTGVLFAPTVASAYQFAEALNAVGISAATIHGELPKNVRRKILRDLDAGRVQVVCNCAALVEGWDCPRVSCVVIARPTRSSVLFVQMAGRALRVDPSRPREGQDALLLDVTAACEEHSLRTIVDLTERPLKVKEDQSLLEAAEEEEEETLAGAREGKPEHRGKTRAVDFDPLVSNSTYVWNKTIEGNYFISCGIGYGAVYVFLVPGEEPGTWDVAWCTKKRTEYVNGIRGAVTERVSLTYELAFAWGEALADEMGGDSGALTAQKGRAWRRRKPSEKQIGMAARMGITVPPGCRSGDLSLLIDSHISSSRVDPIVRYYAEKRI